MHNEPVSSSRGNQSMSMRQIMLCCLVMWKVESLRLERMMRIQFSTCPRTAFRGKTFLWSHSCSRHLLSHRYHLHEDESPLNSSRETCARDSQIQVFFLFLSVKQLWHSVRVACSLLMCRRNNWEKVGVEVSYSVTAEIFEKPEDVACDCVIQGLCSCRGEHQEVIF